MSVVVDNKEYISKDKIIEILGLEENDDITEEKILYYIDMLVRENERLEDIEDRKVQIEYQNVFNKGVKSVKDKIRAEIKELEYVKNTSVKDNSYTYKECIEYGIEELRELLEGE